MGFKPDLHEIVAGRMSHDVYERACLAELIGKRVEAVEKTEAPTQDGDVPVVVLLFDDGTYHAFLDPGED